MSVFNGFTLIPSGWVDPLNPQWTSDTRTQGVGNWVDPRPGWYLPPVSSQAFTPVRPVAAFHRTFNSYKFNSNFEDLYFRVYVTPTEINLGTVASSQSRDLVVWNAWPDRSIHIANITISDPSGISISGTMPPTDLPANTVSTYTVVVGSSGNATIDTYIQFDLTGSPSGVVNPAPVHITGQRAVKFDIIPEVPVEEDWEWKTDLEVAVDGTEQRIALRGEMPRITQVIKILFDRNADVRKQLGLLLTAVGRLWIPSFQYALRVSQASAVGTNRIYFDPTRTDVREGEYVMIQLPDSSTVLMGVLTMNSDGATLQNNLTVTVTLGSIVIPGSPALLPDAQSSDRYAVDDVGSTDLTCRMLTSRTTLIRPGSTATLPTFLGYPVLNKRPLADDNIKEAVTTGQKDLDNESGLLDIISFWDYSRIGGDRSFKVDRIFTPADMDFWKTFLAYTRGQCRKFWMPSYRKDFVSTNTVAVGASSMTLDGTDYAENYFLVPTHRYLRITTAAGTQDVTVTSAGSIAGNSNINFTPALPSTAGWNNVTAISFLLPCRLDNDKVVWKHYGLYSTLDMTIRTAE